MRLREFILALLVGLSLAAGSSAYGQACPLITAPQKFPIKGSQAETMATPGNRGIVPSGFVGLPDGVAVMHGIDVSKWQASADFVRAVACGAKFAYIRMSAGSLADAELEYRSHWANARSVGLLVGPYHNLTLVEEQGAYARLPAARQSQLLELNVASARAQARLFAARLNETLLLDPQPAAQAATAYLGQPYLPIALDVSARPQNKQSPVDRSAFGIIYAAAVCAWIDEIHRNKQFTGQTILLFTLPYVYKDYGLAASDCGIGQLPVWLSYRPLDGDAPEREGNPQTLLAIAELCRNGPAGNRCVIQQYTSWGGFALYQKDEGLDLDRFIGTESALHATLQRALRQGGTH